MYLQATYSGWNFTTTWIASGTYYPTIRWNS
jgi:hypothetical protein